MSQRSLESSLVYKDQSRSIKTYENLDDPHSLIIDKRISANGGKGPPGNNALDSSKVRDHNPASNVESQKLHDGNKPDFRHNINEHVVNIVPGDRPLRDDNVNHVDKVPNEQNYDYGGAAGSDHDHDLHFVSVSEYIPKCNISSKDIVASAISRAKSNQCKQELANVYCLQQEGKLYQLDLPNFCPNRGKDQGHYYGCFRDSITDRDLNGGMVEMATDNSPRNCIIHCFQSATKYAAVQFTKECWCGDSFGKHGAKLEDAHCYSKCPGNASETCGSYLSNKIYGTGAPGIVHQLAPLEHLPVDASKPRMKIVFILTVNGRAVRQVVRLMRVIYSPEHYYYIHVDKRQEFLYRELLPLQQELPNVMLTTRRFSTIWGGASLLQAHLSFLRELFEDKPEWKWDYYINLSESDYPIKPISQLVEFLTAYKGLNFLRAFGKDVPRFIKKQGLDQTFYECENHLWRVGQRPLLRGVVFDGGSDWIGLWRDFAHYATYSSDKLVTGLKQYYKYSLLPVESFFHMTLQNSVYCTRSVDNNLHLTNWKRKQGCKCQYKHIVDWCGCSPNDIKITDWEKLLHYETKPMFFARKFEAIVDQEIINTVDRNFHGFLYQGLPGLNGYWLNVYHHLDKNTMVKNAALTAYASMGRQALKWQNDTTCHLRPMQLLEVNVYNHEDHFHGLLLLYSGQVKDMGKAVTFEVHMEPKHYFTVVNRSGAAGRLQSIEAGTDFDVKELIFRNYGNLMGPFDEISLRHEWGPGAEFTVSIAWVDPTNEIAASYDVHIPTTFHVGNQKPLLNKPLRPGIWKACLMINLKLVAETEFLVTPLTFFDNRPIKESEIHFSHQGPMGLYTSNDFSEFMPNLNLRDDPQLRQDAIVNGKKSGAELEHWVDSLTSLFWVFRQMCLINALDACPSLQECRTSQWSSRSPDLKSDMKYIGSKLPVSAIR